MVGMAVVARPPAASPCQPPGLCGSAAPASGGAGAAMTVDAGTDGQHQRLYLAACQGCLVLTLVTFGWLSVGVHPTCRS